MTETGDRFVPAPRDPTGALVAAVGYETACEEPRDHRGLPSPFLTFIVTLDAPVVIVEVVELGVDVLRLAGRGQHREGNQQHQAAESERRDNPGLEPHGGS